MNNKPIPDQKYIIALLVVDVAGQPPSPKQKLDRKYNTP
jgi:hypothetical protein